MPSQNQIISGSININVLLGFIFGLLFVITMLVFAVLIPNPSEFSQWVFITVLALAGAGVGSVIPGMLNIDLPYVKAGGALAIFVIIFLIKPAIVQHVAKFTPPQASPDPAVESYLAKTDANQMDAAWALLDPEAQSGVARDKGEYRQAYAAGRVPLGSVDHRSLVGIQELQSPPGYPPGIYRILAYQTKFASGDCHSENVIVHSAADQTWRVFENTISPNTVPCTVI